MTLPQAFLRVGRHHHHQELDLLHTSVNKQSPNRHMGKVYIQCPKQYSNRTAQRKQYYI